LEGGRRSTQMAMRMRKEEEKQTKMRMDYKFKKQCIVNISKKKKGIGGNEI
jgi:hypothetical protein